MSSLPPCPERILDIIGQNPSVSKSNQLHVVIFWFVFIDLRCIYSTDSSKTSANFPQILKFDCLSLKLNRLIR
jgi:hypothetical protein